VHNSVADLRNICSIIVKTKGSYSGWNKIKALEVDNKLKFFFLKIFKLKFGQLSL